MGLPLDGLEHRRLELESNIRKLQESLYHWRTWEAEYDNLKEDIDALPDDATAEDLLQTGRDLAGSQVTEEEVKVLLLGTNTNTNSTHGGSKRITRSRQQVVGLISRRIDYVRQNVATMEKRLRAAEDELGRLMDAAGVHYEAEEGNDFPVTEIFEELDEEGNVVSSKVSTPGSQAPELLEVLRRAGVEDIPELRPARGETSTTAEEEEMAKKAPEEEEQQGEAEKVEAKDDDLRSAPSPANNGIPRYTPTVSEQPPEEDREERPVTDVDESPEDAELRRQMLQYGLDEVGAVVAELELDEDGSEISIDDDYDYDDPDEDDEEEDEYGRTTRRVLTDEYHQQMRELEAKLNARGMFNIGKNTDSLPEELRQDLERQPGVVRVEKATEVPTAEAPVTENKKPKKKVAFAEELDIAPTLPKHPAPKEKKNIPIRQSDVPVVSDAIVERSEKTDERASQAAAAAAEEEAPAPPKKVSRFKSARKTETPETSADASSSSAAPPASSGSSSKPSRSRSSMRINNTDAPSSLPLFPAKPKEPKPFSQPINDIVPDKIPSGSEPQPPEGKTLADKLVEREVSAASAAAPEPDELDEQLHRKEIATEFYRMRNRMIQQNGGFVNDEEPEMVPIEPEEPSRRMSKFKAARMR